MQHVRIYGNLEGPEGAPRRLDVDGSGGFRLELHGGAVSAGTINEAVLEGPVTLAAPHKKPVTAEFAGDAVTIDGVELQRMTAGAFSESCKKAEKASQVAKLADHTVMACLQKVEEAVHNSTHNHGVKPQFKVTAPALLRRRPSALEAPGAAAPLKVVGRIDDAVGPVGLSLRGTAASVKQLRQMCTLLRSDVAPRALDLRGALDVKGRPAVTKEEVEAEAEAVAARWGPVGEEEGDETLEKLKEAIAPAEFTSVDQAFKQLAKAALNRTDMVLEAVRDNQTLTALDLSENSLGTLPDGKKSFKQLRLAKAALEDHPTLTQLDLSGNEMGPKGTGVLVKAIVQNVSVQEVDFSGNGIGDDEEDENDEDAEADDPAFGEPLVGLEAFADLIKKNKFVKKLSLARNRIKAIELAEEDLTDQFGEDQPFYKMLHPLKSFHRLQSLDLSGNEIGAGGAFILGAALKRNKSIEALDVSECALGPRGVEVLAEHLAAGNTLRRLRLRRNGLGGQKTKKGHKAAAKAADALAAFFRSDANQLEELDVAYNNLGPALGEVLLRGLAGSATLTALDASLNQLCGPATGEFEPGALHALAEVLVAAPLRRLALKWNFLQPQGATVLAAALKTSGRLEALDVTQNHLRGEGLTAICEAADGLAVLRCGSNGPCGEAASALAALVARSQLATLDVSDNALGTTGAAAVLEATKGSTLTCLDISKNRAGPAAAPEAGRAVQVLRTLLAGDNDFGPAAVADHVLPALKGNTTIRTLAIWGGEGEAAACMDAAVKAVRDCDSLIELDLGVPLVELQGRTADCNAVANKLFDNLRAAEFASAAEVAL